MTQRIIFIICVTLAIISVSYYLALASPQNIGLIYNLKNITPVSPLYPVKLGREKLQSLFIFGRIDQANWNLTLAEKRLTEATTLKNHNLNSLSLIQINQAKVKQSEAAELIASLKDSTDIVYLESKLSSNQQLLDQLE